MDLNEVVRLILIAVSLGLVAAALVNLFRSRENVKASNALCERAQANLKAMNAICQRAQANEDSARALCEKNGVIHSEDREFPEPLPKAS